MSKTRRMTYNGAMVLQALARGCRYGFQVMDFTGLASGTAYPILRRFEVDGLVSSRWEGSREAHRDGRPRRRYYRLTADGEEALGQARERFRVHRRIFGEEESLETR